MSSLNEIPAGAFCGVAAIVAGLLLYAVPVAAQDVRVSPTMVVHIPSVSTILAQFQRQMHDPSYATMQGMGRIIFVLHRWQEFPAKADSLLSNLERLALHSDDPRTRRIAAGLVGAAAERDLAHSKPGILARLMGIYRQTRDPMVRLTVVSELARTSERGPAVAFLKQLATQGKAEEDFQDAAEAAIRSLALMGEEGRAVLRELHQRKLVKAQWARYMIDDLAERDFRLPN